MYVIITIKKPHRITIVSCVFYHVLDVYRLAVFANASSSTLFLSSLYTSCGMERVESEIC